MSKKNQTVDVSLDFSDMNDTITVSSEDTITLDVGAAEPTLTFSLVDDDYEGVINLGEIEETGETRPNHYSQKEGSVECIAVIEQLCEEHQNDPFTDYNRYQAFKYLWRLGKKDDVLYDLRKAKTFIDFAIDRLERERGDK